MGELGDNVRELDCRYGRMAVYVNDLPIAQALEWYGEWAQAELDILLALVKPGETVLDVGAHVGSHTLAFARAVGSEGRVYAFEPQGPLFRLLGHNVRTNGLENVDLFHAAVADAPCIVTLQAVDYLVPNNLGAVRCLFDDAGGSSPSGEKVQAIAIDDLNLASCFLIKVDVEGMERMVLEGAKNTINRFCPLLYLEMTSISSGWNLIQRLHVLGYRTWIHSAKSYNPDNYKACKENFFGDAYETSILAIPSANVRDYENAIRQSPDLVEVVTLDQLASAYFAAPRFEHLEGRDPFTRQLARRKAELEREVARLLKGDTEGQVAYLYEVLNDRDREIASLQRTVKELGEVISQRDSQISSLGQAVMDKQRLADELASVYASKSWAFTSPLRFVWHHMRVLVGSGVQILRGVNLERSIGGYNKRMARDVGGRAHVRVEMVKAQGATLGVSGWAFHEDAPLRSAALIVSSCHREIRRASLTVGVERGDVYEAKGRNLNALRCGFYGTVVLDDVSSDEVYIELEFLGHSPIRRRVYLKDLRASIPGRILQIWRRIDRIRVLRAVRYLLRGEYKELWRRLSRLISSSLEGEIVEAESLIKLRAAIDLLKTESSIPRIMSEQTDIIIPVYNGFEYLGRLFRSLKINTRSPHRLIVVDDASTDGRVWPFLVELLRDYPSAVLIRNESNLVILNTDTEVPPYWLERLMSPIRVDRTIASTTPFTNAATIASFPEINMDNAPFGGLLVERIDRQFMRIRDDLPMVELPSGIGFCMGVNGEAWRRVGKFDEEAFGLGYGEENDWCLRASTRGYRNVMVPNLFVYHRHGGSFASETRSALRQEALRKVMARYPDYQRRVEAFCLEDPLRLYRQTLSLLIMCCESGKLPVLIIDHDLGGGANIYRREMITEALRSDRPVLLLVSRHHQFGEKRELRCLYREYKANFEVDDFSSIEALCTRYIPLGEIFYNDLVGFSRPLDVVEAMRRIKLSTCAPMTIAIHDFYPVCPSYTLVNARGVYCRLPDISECRKCLPRNQFAANPEGDLIDTWRSVWAALLGVAEQIVCFSEDSRRHLERVYPGCRDRIVVRPHIKDAPFARMPKVTFDGPLHVGVIGAISLQKGAEIVREVARRIERIDSRARITVIGTILGGLDGRNTNVSGPYDPSQLPELIERYEINMCFFPSIWPETYSYTCDEVMALGLPLVAFDIGAPSERIASYPLGRLVGEVSAAAAADELIRFYRELVAGSIRPGAAHR
jgi:FkbM family methyltransferase